MNKVVDYIKSVRVELSKVVWPKREDVLKLTLTVVVMSAIVGLYVGSLDFLFIKALEYIISR